MKRRRSPARPRRAVQKNAQMASFPALNPSPVLETDEAGRVTYLNAAAKAEFPNLARHQHHPLLKESRMMRRLAETQGGHSRVRRFKEKGRTYEQRLSYVPKICRVRSYVVDVTEQDRAESLKDELLSVLAHELRVPVTAIQAGIGLLRDESFGKLSKDQQECLETVDQEIRRLDRLFQKVLLAAGLLAGTTEYSLRTVKLDALLDKICKQFHPFAKERKVVMRCVAGAGRPVCVGDERWLKEAIDELVENAIHASSGGTVTLHYGGASKFGRVVVKDTGSGIPRDQLPVLFDRLGWIGGMDDRKTGGLGLGLFIAKTIISAHGGNLKVTSASKRGTSLMVEIPNNPSCVLPKSSAK